MGYIFKITSIIIFVFKTKASWKVNASNYYQSLLHESDLSVQSFSEKDRKYTRKSTVRAQNVTTWEAEDRRDTRGQERVNEALRELDPFC